MPVVLLARVEAPRVVTVTTNIQLHNASNVCLFDEELHRT